MTIGEALTRRSDLKKEIVELRNRVHSHATYTLDKDGADDRTEKGEDFLAELNHKQAELSALIQKINQTNASATLNFNGSPMTLDAAITLRAYYSAMSTQYRELVPRLRITKVSDKLARAQARNQVYAYHNVKDLTPEKMDELVNNQLESQPVQHVILSQQEAQKRADEFSAQYRALDLAIQQANWSTSLAA